MMDSNVNNLFKEDLREWQVECENKVYDLFEEKLQIGASNISWRKIDLPRKSNSSPVFVW